MKKILLLLLLAFSGILYAQQPQKDTLSGKEEELDEVIIQSTRTSRSIRNTPTRVETIDGEELDEKANMQARAGITMALHESTGLQVQQTSATSGNYTPPRPPGSTPSPRSALAARHTSRCSSP